MTPVRCSCKGTLPGSCNCSISDSSTIEVTGDGSAASPHTLAPDLAAAPGLLSCTADGLLGKWPSRVLSPPRAKVWRETSQAFTFPGSDEISFDTVIYDTDSFWNAGAPTRLTNNLGMTALFGVGASVSLRLSTVASTEDTWFLLIVINGVTSLVGNSRSNVDGAYAPSIAPVALVAIEDNLSTYAEIVLDDGDFIEVLCASTGSPDLSIIPKPRLAPMFSMTYLSD